jgi:hypothetical protein
MRKNNVFVNCRFQLADSARHKDINCFNSFIINNPASDHSNGHYFNNLRELPFKGLKLTPMRLVGGGDNYSTLID